MKCIICDKSLTTEESQNYNEALYGRPTCIECIEPHHLEKEVDLSEIEVDLSEIIYSKNN